MKINIGWTIVGQSMWVALPVFILEACLRLMNKVLNHVLP